MQIFRAWSPAKAIIKLNMNGRVRTPVSIVEALEIGLDMEFYIKIVRCRFYKWNIFLEKYLNYRNVHIT